MADSECMRDDVRASADQPETDNESVFADLPVALDLDDGHVDYDALYGQ